MNPWHHSNNVYIAQNNTPPHNRKSRETILPEFANDVLITTALHHLFRDAGFTVRLNGIHIETLFMKERRLRRNKLSTLSFLHSIEAFLSKMCVFQNLGENLFLSPKSIGKGSNN